MGLTYQRMTTMPERPARNALLVASRWPLRCLRPAAAPDEPGRWLPVRVGAPQPFALGAMHIPNRETGRKYIFHDASVCLASRWRRSPAMLVGDTNTGWPGLDEEVPCFGRREQAFLTSIDALGWADAFRRLRGRTRAYSWYSPNGRNGFRLDQAFLNPPLLPRLRGARYAWGDDCPGALSDHAALLVDLA